VSPSATRGCCDATRSAGENVHGGLFTTASLNRDFGFMSIYVLLGSRAALLREN